MKKSFYYLLIILALITASCNTDTPAITPSATVTVVDIPSNTPTIAPSTTVIQIPAPTATPGIPLFSDDQLKSRIDQLAAAFLEQYHNPGLSVAVVMHDPLTGRLEAMLLNYGKMSKGSDQPVTSDTVYEIGSITKVFTGILLAEKVNDGTVKLDDSIQKYMPDNVQAPQYKDTPITLVDLATHRSGLPRDLNSDDLAVLYLWLNSFKPAHAPGSQYIYSNLGYMLLGDILSRLSQNEFGSLEFASVSQPMGLMDTREVLTDEESERLAQGYTRFLLANMEPDSTPLAASIKLAQTMQAEGRNPGTGTGLGWEIDNPGKPNERIWKGGGTPGFTSYISFAVDDSFGFVLLSNGQKVENLAPSVAQLLTQLTER
jgi:D-alanyl-D-alanine-carboxypeptidase/D-alanyl-D-alanine-endopeptidase